MDDPGWSWPAWKFGLKRDDLFSSLHEQYNTFTFSLQDPEAFHADVYEISNGANTTEEFHRLMADRRQQRLRELHESLESLAVEIIANPRLMDSQHWNYALQLFRTRSFDSLVRYFASYLPEDYYKPSPSSSFSDAASTRTASTKASSVDDAPAHSPSSSAFFDGADVTEEPCSYDAVRCPEADMNVPLYPPESETMVSGASVSTPTDELEPRSPSTNCPSRSMSFCGFESETFCHDFRRPIIPDDDDASLSDSVDTVVSSVSDCAESHSSLDSVDDKKHDSLPIDEEDDELLTAQFPEDEFDAYDTMRETAFHQTVEFDTPTPRPERDSNSHIDVKSVLSRRLPSPPRRSPSPRLHRGSGTSVEVRRSPDEAHSKIQKTTSDPIRKRPKGRG